MNLFTAYLGARIPYTGLELSPHWIARRTGRFENSIVAFRGPCSVATGEMVDMEDRFAEARIEAKEMLHFLGEWFDGDLSLAVARQRLLIAGFGESLGALLPSGRAWERRGNDLYIAGEGGGAPAKLSVSIVTATPVSTLFHFGVNVDCAGAPVRAVGLSELGIGVDALAEATLHRWGVEWAGMEKARCKVSAR